MYISKSSVRNRTYCTPVRCRWTALTSSVLRTTYKVSVRYQRLEINVYLSISRENDFMYFSYARLSKGFRVKNFVVKDASVYPIEVRKIVRYFVCPL
jgi:hypothetical protein